jgi:hypothetical protein
MQAGAGYSNLLLMPLLTSRSLLMCRRRLVIVKIFVADALSFRKDLKYPPIRGVLKLALLTVAVIGMLMLLISAMDYVFYKLLAEHKIKVWAELKALRIASESNSLKQ